MAQNDKHTIEQIVKQWRLQLFDLSTKFPTYFCTYAHILTNHFRKRKN